MTHQYMQNNSYASPVTPSTTPLSITSHTAIPFVSSKAIHQFTGNEASSSSSNGATSSFNEAEEPINYNKAVLQTDKEVRGEETSDDGEESSDDGEESSDDENDQ